MPAQQPATPRRTTDPRPGSETRVYASFVVRLWADLATGEMLRVEVEHVQSGTCARAGRVPLEWIARHVRACVYGHPADDDALG